MVKNIVDVAMSRPFGRRCTLKVFSPDGKQRKVQRYSAPFGKTLNHHKMIVKTLAGLEQEFPQYRYEPVAVPEGFNMVCRGLK